jgi:phospholipase C
VWPIAGAILFMAAAGARADQDSAMPRYAHIVVIIEENHTADQIIGSAAAPNINRLAKDYGYASNFYAERHPSEPNYVAIVGGDTFGIADDDAFWCKPKQIVAGCPHANSAGYVDHTVTAPGLTDQLASHALSWKGYFESIPEPGSRVWRWPAESSPVPGKPLALYASKHNGFINFRSVQADPAIASHIVGFDALDRDIAGNTLPAYAHVVPNQCNDMHGLHGREVPADCVKGEALVKRGDALAGVLVDKLMHSAAWNAAGNFAIVITFDENDDDTPTQHPVACCGGGPGDPHNPGGGWIPTIVITNHGPRHLTDPTPYNHYSLLRTTEAAFGISDYLGHAADAAKGVRTMAPLFAVATQK